MQLLTRAAHRLTRTRKLVLAGVAATFLAVGLVGAAQAATNSTKNFYMWGYQSQPTRPQPGCNGWYYAVAGDTTASFSGAVIKGTPVSRYYYEHFSAATRKTTRTYLAGAAGSIRVMPGDAVQFCAEKLWDGTRSDGTLTVIIK